MRRVFRGGCSWLVAISAVVLSVGLNTASANEEAGDQPNILFLFTDDQRPDAVGALGNPVIKTPTMDTLVEDGFVFRNAYCFGANCPAVCRPSRNMLLSGRAYFRWEGSYAPADEPNLPATLKRVGYITYHHGKKSNTARRIHEVFDVSKYVNDREAVTTGHPGRKIVDEAISFLKEQGDRRPFFMYLAFANPHDPRIAAQRYLDLYDLADIELPANFLPMHPFDNGEMIIRDELLAPWPRTPMRIRRELRDYYAVITGLDYHLSRLLSEVRKLDRKTIIIFASDNGLALGSHGLMGKQNLYEHSAGVPLVITGPGIPKGRSDALVYLMDLFPTICDLIDAPVPSNLDGKSLTSVMAGQSEGVREEAFLAYRDVQRAVRDQRWKLIRYPQINRTQLFDLEKDPHELHNLADNPDHAKRIEHLVRRLEHWQKHFGDTTPLTVSDPENPTFVPPTSETLQKQLDRWNMKPPQ